MMKINTHILVFGILISFLGASQGSKLTNNFYKHSCEEAETIVKKVTEKHVASNPAVPARLLRMHFHDCFVRFKKSMWEVPTGRRDGKVSRKNEAQQNIPPPSFNFSRLKQNFATKGLSVHDLVEHTQSVAFNNRLYNFTGKGDQDPSLDKNYAKLLKTKCPPNDKNTTVQMDPGSALKFDSSYYGVVLKHKGLFTSDAALVTNKVGRNTVQELVHQNDFFLEFALSMKKMGAIEVLTGTAGEIRKKCWATNIMMMKINTLILVFVVLIGLLGASKGSKLTPNFYKHSCEEAETIVKKATEKHVASNPAVPARLLRMHFHDCFVRFKKSMWEVPTGRRDGKVSRKNEAQQNIPPPSFNFSRLKQNFATKGDQDPSLDKNYAKLLKTKCPPNDKNTTVQMDPGSALKFDSSYYGVVLKHKGLFTSDAALVTNKVARNTVQELVYQNDFFLEFALSMKKMGAIEVLTGTAGEIRKKCWT
ncbi:hypothetical protein G4B88_026846, partial [Cannabis sativa]